MSALALDLTPLRVLLAEADDARAAWWRQQLAANAPAASETIVVGTLTEALTQLGEVPFDLVLASLSLPDESGDAVVRALHDRRPAATVVALLPARDEALASASIAAGAQDYLLHEHETPRALRRVLRAAAARTAQSAALREAEREAVRRATHDELTGLPVRALLLDRLDLALKAGARYGHAVAVAYLNLDGLRTINDQYGREIGDAVLRHAATVLHQGVRSCDTLARLGGDEFCLLLARVPERAGAETAMRVLTRLLSGQPITAGGTIIAPMMSFGLAFSPDDGRSPEDLLGVAEARMYVQKREHHARFV